MNTHIPFDHPLAAPLALWRIPGMGPKTYGKLKAKCPQLREIFNRSAAQLQQWGLKTPLIEQLRQPNWAGVEQDLLWQEKDDQHICIEDDINYPPLLREISDPPPILYIKGNLKVVSLPQLAMVGSRNPTPTGAESAFAFAKSLSQSGLVITSGLALGIDGASHQGALKAKGQTIAVMACGLDRIYPYQHRQLAQAISQQGALVSEFPIGTPPIAKHFPRRNRIISGMSIGVLVVEAALKSGSLITARYGLEQGRDIFTLPGSIHNPMAKGCHALIRQGAALIETVDDILLELTPQLGSTIKNMVSKDKEPMNLHLLLDQSLQKLVECVGYEATPTDLIASRCQLDIPLLGSKLVQLELEGYIQSVPGGYIRIQPVHQACTKDK